MQSTYIIKIQDLSAITELDVFTATIENVTSTELPNAIIELLDQYAQDLGTDVDMIQVLSITLKE
jgi:membrane protease subunit (stomatin/prohibitin family)